LCKKQESGIFGKKISKRRKTVTLTNDNTQSDQIGQAEFQVLLQEKLRQAVRVTMITILEEEVEAFIGAGLYQRTPGRRDQRNGHYLRDLVTGVGKIQDLSVPRTRKGFQTRVFERYKRRQAELDEAICDMFVQGMSQVRVGEVFETLTGTQPSPSTVSKVFHSLEGEFKSWKERPLEERYVYAFADGTYFSVIYDGQGHKMPVLAVVGINEAGKREVLGFSVGERENQDAWEALFDDLKRRGVKKVDLGITDGNQATINALELKFPDSQRQRCVKHKMENVLGYIPQSQQDAVKPELRAILYQESREKADQEVVAFCEKFAPLYPSAVECLKRDLEACLTFYTFPQTHWKTIRTTNVLERMFGEVKKRSHKMAAAFRNENSCLLMFYAVIRSLRFQNLRMPAKEPDSAILHKT
jgi:putative transposase